MVVLKRDVVVVAVAVAVVDVDSFVVMAVASDSGSIVSMFGLEGFVSLLLLSLVLVLPFMP